MDKEELKKMLKENLSVKVSTRWMGSQKQLHVTLMFDGEEFSDGFETIEWDDDF